MDSKEQVRAEQRRGGLLSRLRPGEPALSLGTSGTAYAAMSERAVDPSGLIAGFADATGGFLPLAATLNCTLAVDRVAGHQPGDEPRQGDGHEERDEVDERLAAEIAAHGLLDNVQGRVLAASAIRTAAPSDTRVGALPFGPSAKPARTSTAPVKTWVRPR